jgi:hypothetical protein
MLFTVGWPYEVGGVKLSIKGCFRNTEDNNSKAKVLLRVVWAGTSSSKEFQCLDGFVTPRPRSSNMVT